MDDKRILNMYLNGYSIDYIARIYYKYKNRNQKSIILNGTKLFPAKIYTLSDCKVYVYHVVYDYIVNNGEYPQTQIDSFFGCGAI